MACLMQSILLCGVPLSETPLVGYLGDVPLLISEHGLNDAISLSVALKHVESILGGTADSRVSSFTQGSARMYISMRF
jgi:hypothetical protein